ncbi:helix-turn-helix domain-containing protein [Paenibacillus antarcticus]|uniref:Helix-turn-helix domain-containing protein n=1 Tax=Paenibacillus antarcticus TaxID=253703 RepID=A0A168KL40_9BACL|nr:helix-turn-helix domain-containing protein [Paenibacillus antarcticus]OAB42167.1 hypothetical protein PBAT_20390 [Paenibacillus antarcticus]
MSDEKWLTVSEVAERFGIPQPTIRRYIERHGHHLHIRKHHKSYLIAEKSLADLVRIRESYSQGMNADQVENELAAVNAPTIIDVIATSDRMSDVSPEALSSLHSAMIERFERQEDFNHALIEAMQHERVENQRQRALDREQIERLTVELTDARDQAASTNENLKNEIRKGQQDTTEQLGEILTRIETYGKQPRGLFGWFRR